MSNILQLKRDVTCVLNAHSEGYILNQTIKSLKRSVEYAQDCGLSVDICIVLDKATQRTSDVVYRMTGKNENIIETEYGDAAQARNRAVKESQSKYIAFIDGDDLWCKNWIVDSYLMSEHLDEDIILHPEYNIYFGSNESHVLKHVDMESENFSMTSFFKENYWTALSFSKKITYEKHPYQKNSIDGGFGYEDWTWNYDTAKKGVVHKIVPGTSHYIRRGKTKNSMLDITNTCKAVPRILQVYRNEL